MVDGSVGEFTYIAHSTYNIPHTCFALLCATHNNNYVPMQHNKTDLDQVDITLST